MIERSIYPFHILYSLFNNKKDKIFLRDSIKNYLIKDIKEIEKYYSQLMEIYDPINYLTINNYNLIAEELFNKKDYFKIKNLIELLDLNIKNLFINKIKELFKKNDIFIPKWLK